jgi:hypothetical protein
MGSLVWSWGIAAALLVSAVTSARSEDLAACRAIKDDTARLNCYDVLVDQGASAGDALHHSQSVMALSAWATYWVIGEPGADGSPICVPAVRFKLTNQSGHDLDGVEISAAFLNDAEKTTFGSSVVFWSATTGQPPLPPGYSRDTELRGPRGFVYLPGSCTEQRLPNLTVKVRAKLVGDSNDLIPLGEGAINNSKAFFFNPATQSGMR